MHTRELVSNKAVEKERLPSPTQLGLGNLTENEGMTDSQEMTGTHAEKLGQDELCSPWGWRAPATVLKQLCLAQKGGLLGCL